jgi:hypothetical protein
MLSAQVLQSLEAGRKGQPPIFLGAAAVASLPPPSNPSSSKLQQWVHASLNEQLLGSRLAALVGQQEALGFWYDPGAILLQLHLVRPVVKAVKGCDVLRFDLTVGRERLAAGDVGSSSSSSFQNPGGAVGAAAAAAAASLGFKGLAQRLGGSLAEEGEQQQRRGAPAAAAGGGSHRSKGRQKAAAGGIGGGQTDLTAVPNAVATFQWPGAAAAAAGGGGGGVGGDLTPEGIHRGPVSSGRRRRVVPIKEVVADGVAGETESVASATTGFLSPSSSGMLSPLATSEDAAADWWNPLMEAYGSSAAGNAPEGPGGHHLGAGGEQGAAVVLGREAARHGGLAAASAGGGGGGAGHGVEAVGGSSRSASMQLEQQLSASLAAPLPELLSCRRGSAGKRGREES